MMFRAQLHFCLHCQICAEIIKYIYIFRFKTTATKQHYLNVLIVIYTNSAILILKDLVRSRGPHLKVIEISYYAQLLKEEKKNTDVDHSQNFYENAQQTKHQIRPYINKKVIHWTAWNWKGFPKLRISYKLPQRTKKLNSLKKFLKTNNIIFGTVRWITSIIQFSNRSLWNISWFRKINNKVEQMC